MPKECKNKQCLFNEENPDGCPDTSNFCSKCGSELKMKITESLAEPELPTSSDKLKLDIEKKLMSSIFYEYPLIVFTTFMVKSDFEAIKGHLTIRFRNPKLGGFQKEMVLFQRQGELIEFENAYFVILKGTLKLSQVILQYLYTEVAFGIAYKYFLAEKEEQIPWFDTKFDRCLYLSNQYFEKKIYNKYDTMPVYCIFEDKSLIWRLSFSILAIYLTLDPTNRLTAFEEKVSSLKSMTTRFFHSRYIKQSNSIDRDILNHNLCVSFNLQKQEKQVTTEWYLNQFPQSINPENFLKNLFLILFLYYKQELSSIERNLFRKVYKYLTTDHIEYIISNKVHTVLIGMFQNREKSLHCLQKSFNATLFDEEISNTKTIIRLLPLYHYIFDIQKQFAYEHKHHNFTNNEYWGFPSTISLKKFFCEKEIEDLGSFITLMGTYDPIILDSIVLLTLNLGNIHILSNITSIPIVSFVAVIIYRIKNWEYYQADSTLRYKALAIIYNKITCNAYSINHTDLDELCDTLFILWELTSEEHFSEHYMTYVGVLLHLELTGKVLQMYDEIHPNMLVEKVDFEPQPCKHLKTSEELLNIILKLLEKFLIAPNAEVNKILKNMEFWDILFKIQFPKSYSWTDIVEKCFILLIQTMCLETTIDIFIAMSRLTCHEKMFYSFKDRIIDNVTSDQHINEQEKILRKLGTISHNSPAVLMEIWNAVLEQQKDIFKQDPTIHVLSWSPWSIIFKLQITEKIENPHKEVQILLEEARKEFFVVVDKLRNTQIPIRILRHITKSQPSFFKMYEIFMSDEVPSISKEFIQELIETLEYFDDRFKCIRNSNYILNYTNHLFECQEIKDFFRIDFESQPLNEVCLKNPSCDYCFVPQSLLAKKINTPGAKSMFINSSNLKESTIFLNILKQFISSKYELSQSIIVELAAIYEELWQPAIIECENLINELFTQTISLSNVEKHFRIYVGAEENMATDISHICCVINVKSDVSYSPDLIRGSSRQVINYFKLHESCEFADSISHVRDKYCPEGNFHEVDLLVKLKNIHFTDKNQLKVVTKELIKLSSQLYQYDSYAKDLLDAFIDHPHFINWARITLKDREQLKVFVDLALASCGETDFETCRVKSLRSVCYHLSPLIFDLQPNSDCTEFLTLYNGVLRQIIGGEENFLTVFYETANLLHIWRQILQSGRM